MIGQIKMLGHGKTSSMIAGIMIVSLHRPKVLTKTVCKFTASFPNVQHVTSLAKDRVDHASGSTMEPLFEVNTSARGSYRISLRRVVTGAKPGSVAWKCSWWCLVLPPKAKNLTVDQPRTSKFYMLPKIHKPGNPGRPIVSACNCPTSNISAYLDSVMAPLVKQLPTYVKDSSHALQILESFSFTGSHRYLFTMDIRSLYTVIPNNDGLQALKYHLDLRPEQQPPANTLAPLAELVLNLNCFDFDGNYYQ